MVPPVETQNPFATKPVRDFRYVYTHRLKVPTSEPVPAIPSPVDGPPPLPSAPPSDLDILIAFRKDKRSCIDHPISNFISYDHLNPTFRQFALSFYSESIRRSYTEALLVPALKQLMDEKIETLASSGTCELVSVPTYTAIVGCRWVLSTAQMDLWIDIRPDSWPKVIIGHMTSTIMRHFHSCQDEFYQDSVLH